MKLTHVQTTEIPLGHKACIEEIYVVDKEYALEVAQGGLHGARALILSFIQNDEVEFEIAIDTRGRIRFERHVYRPHHDHDDRETLQVASGESVGTWIERFPYNGEGREFLYVDFGAVEAGY